MRHLRAAQLAAAAALLRRRGPFGGSARGMQVYDGDVQLGGRQSTPWQRRVGAQISLAFKNPMDFESL